MKKRYGDAKTSLTLSEKAQKFYNSCDPISICEIEVDDRLVYDLDICGAIYKDLTAEEVNECLENLQDEIDADEN